MSTALNPVITHEGWTAITRAADADIKLALQSIALGDKGYTITGDETQLQHECQRVAIAESQSITPQQLQLSALVSGSDEYWIKEIGFYLDDCTLFALWSDPHETLAYKAKNVELVLTLDLVLSAIPAEQITIINNNTHVTLGVAYELSHIAVTCIDTMRRQIQLTTQLFKGAY